MKSKRNKSLLTILLAMLLTFSLSIGIGTMALAQSSPLGAGASVSLGEVDFSKNYKITFNSNVNVNGVDNALVFALTDEHGNYLTEAHSVVGAIPANSILNMEGINAVWQGDLPTAVGTKNESVYAIETKDLVLLDGVSGIKNASFKVLATKGNVVDAQISCAEVKYLVKFGDAEGVEYSYNQTILAPEDAVRNPDLTYHYIFEQWNGDDESVFASGVKATKNVVYTAQFAQIAHELSNVAEVPATEQSNGILAHSTCSGCSVLIKDNSVVSQSDLIIPAIGHTHNYVATFDWSNALVGEKPVVVFNCSCGATHTLDAQDISLVEKENSRVEPSCVETGSVVFVASATHDGVTAQEEKEYVLEKVDHSLGEKVQAQQPQLGVNGNLEYWECSVCHAHFKDENASAIYGENEWVIGALYLEDANVVSISDFTRGGAYVGDFVKVESNTNYQYDSGLLTSNGSIIFKAQYYTKEFATGDVGATQIRLHESWGYNGTIWFKAENTVMYHMEGSSPKHVLADALEEGAVTKFEYGRRAIMNANGTFSGEWYTYLIIGDSQTPILDWTFSNISNDDHDSAWVKASNTIFITSSGAKNIFFDIDFNAYKTVVFKNGEEVLDTQTVVYGDKAVAPEEPTAPQGLYFHGWSADGETVFDPTTSVITQDLVLYPLFGQEVAIVTFKDGDTILKEERVVKGETVGEFMPEYDILASRKVFMGWKVNGEGEIFDYATSLNEDTVLVASWANLEDCLDRVDAFSISDLLLAGQPVGDIITCKGIYTRPQSNSNGSALFKFQFDVTQWAVDDDGFQVGFSDQTHPSHLNGSLWLRPDRVRIIKYANGNTSYVTCDPITTGIHDVEYGRLAILAGDNSIGYFYIYVKINGVLFGEYVTPINTIASSDLSNAGLYLTGTQGVPNNMMNADFSGELTVTFVNASTRETIVDTVVLFGEVIQEPDIPQAPQVEGKTFIGWYDENGEQVDFASYEVRKNVNIYAIYQDVEMIEDEVYFDDSSFLPVLRFAIASDVHIGDATSIRNTRLNSLFDIAYAYAQQGSYSALDAVLFAGDLSDVGSAIQLSAFKAIVDAKLKSGTQLLVTMGNHEFYNGLSTEQTIQNFMQMFGENAHVVINGFHFIYFAPDVGQGEGFSAQTLRWVENELAIAVEDNPNLPIFVMQHQHPQDTVYGSDDWGRSELNAIFNKYPQVVDFSGHSHYPINDPRSAWQGIYTAFGTGTLHYYETGINGYKTAGVFPTGNGGWASSPSAGSSAGLFQIVEVDATGSFRISIIEIDTNQVIGYYYVRNAAEGFKLKYSHTIREANSEKPAFKQGEQLTVSCDSLRAQATVTIPQAVCSTDPIDHYRVELYLDGVRQSVSYVLSDYFFIPTPESVSITLSNLLGEREYTVKVYAVSAWGKISETALEKTFVTDEQRYTIAYFVDGKEVANRYYFASDVNTLYDEHGNVADEPEVPSIHGAIGRWEYTSELLNDDVVVYARYDGTVTTTDDNIVLDKYDGKIVDSAHDIVRFYLNLGNASQQEVWLQNWMPDGTYDKQSLVFSWEGASATGWTLMFAQDQDFTKPFIVDSRKFPEMFNGNSISGVGIFVPGKTYYWKVISNDSGKSSAVDSFTVLDAPVRWISADTIYNMRDIGGWTTVDGQQVAYGNIYRGGQLALDLSHELSYMSDYSYLVFDYLGMKSEIELRGDIPVHTETQWNKYLDCVYVSGASYGSVEGGSASGIFGLNSQHRAMYREVFALLANKDNYPVYFHCSWGADRTGTLAYLINGLLGVPYEQLAADFELTSFSGSGIRERAAAFDAMHRSMMSEYGTESGLLKDAIERYLKEYLGVPQQHVDAIRSIMLEEKTSEVEYHEVSFIVDGQEYYTVKVVHGQPVFLNSGNLNFFDRFVVGWLLNGEPYNMESAVLQDLVLTAQFEQVVFDKYDEFTMSDLVGVEEPYTPTLNQVDVGTFEGYHNNGYRVFTFKYNTAGVTDDGIHIEIADPMWGMKSHLWLQSDHNITIYTAGDFVSPIIKGFAFDPSRDYIVSVGIVKPLNGPYANKNMFFVIIDGQLLGCYEVLSNLENHTVSFAGTQGTITSVELLRTVEFWVDGQLVRSEVVANGQTIASLQDPTAPEGKYFVGWIDDYGRTWTSSSIVRADMTLTAVFEEFKLSVSVVDQDGNHLISGYEVAVGSRVADLQVPVVSGEYQFAGWYNGQTKLGENDVITSDMVLTAMFESIGDEEPESQPESKPDDSSSSSSETKKKGCFASVTNTIPMILAMLLSMILVMFIKRKTKNNN